MKLPLILALLVGTISDVVSEDIPVTKCCSSDQYYDTGHNECANVTGSNGNWSVAVSSRPRTSPKLYSLDKLNVTENLQICPDGYLVQSTRQFLLFDNGTLSVSATPSTLLPGTFCIERALYSAHESIEIIIARFCRPDPCNAAACVKKCCPEGHSFEGETCVPSSSAFPLKFNNEKGDTVPLQEGSYAIRAGGLPSCPDKTLLDPFEYQEDDFVILPTGQLFVPVFKNGPVLDDYCIEDFVSYADDGTDEYQRKAVVCLMPVTLTAGERFVLTIYSYLLFFASIFLVATFVVYLIIPEIRNIHGVTVMCHCASLAGTFICIGIINLKNDFDFVSCVVLAVFTHFFFLSSFTWLNVLSFDIWWTLRDLRPTSPRRGYGANRIKSRFAYYSIYAWGVPVIIVAVGQILDHVHDLPSSILTPDFGELKCWFSGLDNAILAYLYGPIATLLVSNVIFFTLTAIHLHNAQKDSKIATKRKKKKEKTTIIFSLFLLMGMTWVTEIITWAVKGSPYFSIPTDILNISTGVFIFVIFVCKKKVRRLLQKKFLPVRRLISGRRSILSNLSVRNGVSFSRNRSTTTSDLKDVTMSEFSSRETTLQEIDLSK